MKCYINEINKLRKENMEIGEKVCLLENEERIINDEYRDSLKQQFCDLVCGFEVSYDGLTKEEAIIVHRYDEILTELSDLRRLFDRNCMHIDHLRAEYKRLHTEDFYRSMDDVDIFEEIGRNGFIVALKF